MYLMGMRVCMPLACPVPREVKTDLLELECTGGCGLPCGCWALSVGPLQDRWVLLTAEPCPALLPLKNSTCYSFPFYHTVAILRHCYLGWFCRKENQKTVELPHSLLTIYHLNIYVYIHIYATVNFCDFWTMKYSMYRKKNLPVSVPSQKHQLRVSWIFISA